MEIGNCSGSSFFVGYYIPCAVRHAELVDFEKLLRRIGSDAGSFFVLTQKKMGKSCVFQKYSLYLQRE
jgi:hypothetical protein